MPDPTNRILTLLAVLAIAVVASSTLTERRHHSGCARHAAVIAIAGDCRSQP